MTKDVNLHTNAVYYHRTTFFDIANTISIEVAVHRTLCSEPPERQGRRHILPYCGFNYRQSLKTYRLTTNFAEGGDMWYWMQEFFVNPRKPQLTKEGKTPEPPTHKNRPKIPVAYAWKIFSAIVEAAIYMHGKDVFHRDLRLDNIFLTVERDPEKQPDKRKNRDKDMDDGIGEEEEKEEEEEEEEEEERNETSPPIMGKWRLKPLVADFG